MPQPISTISLILLTALTLSATVMAWVRLIGKRPVGGSLDRSIIALTVLCTFGALGLFLYRWLIVNSQWQPLTAHVDGLLLIAVLLAGLILFLRSRAQVPGIAAFGLPVLTLVLAWAICASAWTFHPFPVGSVWLSLHLASVYVGTAMLAVAAMAGGLYLFAERRLRHKQAAPPPRLGSLEAIERVIIRTSTAGFGILTLGLLAGAVIYATEATTPGWWYAPKIILAVIVWCIYAVVMNVRHTTRFRGARAAWLSILGLVLLLAVWVFAISFLGDPPAVTPPQEPGTAMMPHASHAQSLPAMVHPAQQEARPCES